MARIYGYSTSLDLVDCISAYFTRDRIELYLFALCQAIDMEREDLHFWDYEGNSDGYEAAPPHLRGVSAVQFIKTSSIVIHTLDDLKAMFVDLFSCKEYDPRVFESITEMYFGGTVRASTTVMRAT